MTRSSSVVAVALALVACSGSEPQSNEPTQTSTPSSTTPPPPASQSEAPPPPPQPSAAASSAASAAPSSSASGAPTPGGYMTQNVTDKEIKAEADQAITLLQADRKDPKLALVSIKSAATQVVAGINYKLEIEVKTGGATKVVTVILNKDPSGKRKLSDVKGF